MQVRLVINLFYERSLSITIDHYQSGSFIIDYDRSFFIFVNQINILIYNYNFQIQIASFDNRVKRYYMAAYLRFLGLNAH